MNPTPSPGLLFNFVLPGDPSRQKLDRIRASIAEKQDERKALKNAGLPLEEARPRLIGAIERDDVGLSGNGFREPLCAGSGIDLPRLSWGVVALLLGGSDKLADLIIERVFKKSGFYTPGLPTAEREKKVAALGVEIRALEHQEEIETLAIERAGRVALRRDDVENFDILIALWEEPDAGRAAAAVR